MTKDTTLTRPLVTIKDVRPVDDAGQVHYETVMTAAFILNLVDEKLLLLEGNIRPDHMPGHKLGTKTARKINAWADELLRNNAVIGNISIRLDPACDFVVEEDEDEEGRFDLYLLEGVFDCGIDSLSRIKAILRAGRSPAASFDLSTRFAVRLWVADRTLGNRVASIYNTRGDKVNDTAAKYAYQNTASERMARELMNKSPHLGLDNVEVLANSVSASSNKLVAFNTLAQAITTFWEEEPLDEAAEEGMVEYLVSFWDELVRVRSEFGRLSKSQRQSVRGSLIAGTALSIHGVVAVADALFKKGDSIEGALARLSEPVNVDEEVLDYFSYDNPVWVKRGILVPATDKQGNERKNLRMSFQTRKAMANELIARLRI
jgi:hypothetical protein